MIGLEIRPQKVLKSSDLSEMDEFFPLFLDFWREYSIQKNPIGLSSPTCIGAIR